MPPLCLMVVFYSWLDMHYAWKILEIYADNEVVTAVKYHCRGFDEVNSVETEGLVTFENAEVKTPFKELTQELVVEWIENATTVGGECLVKKRLEEQLKTIVPVRAPWEPPVFEVRFEV